jgi:acetyltransferase-like isoleucine patch superfamily enzyme
MRPFAPSIRVINAGIEEAFSRELAKAGFEPAWTSVVSRTRNGDDIALADPSGMEAETTVETAELIDAPEALLPIPPADWPEEVLALWQMGFVYLRMRSAISPFARISGQRILLRGCKLGDFGVVDGYNSVLTDSNFASHYRITGPAVIDKSLFGSFVCIGPYVDILDSGIGHSSNVHRGVELRSAWVAGSAVVEGGVIHRSHSPLRAAALEADGIRVGARSWIGQHSSLHPGTRIGEGVLVVAGSAVANDVGSHAMVMGSHGGTPIDVHVRGLTAEAAFALGRNQGGDAAVLPIYGVPEMGFRAPEVLEVDYAKHGVLSGAAHSRIVDFQRGALLAAMQWLLPSYAPEVSVAIGASVRFTVQLNRPFEPHSPCDRDVRVSGSVLGEDDGSTVEGVIASRFFASLGHRGGPTQSEYDTRKLLVEWAAAGKITPPLLPSLEDLNIDEVLVLKAFTPVLTAQSPPLAPFASNQAGQFLHDVVRELVGEARLDRAASFEKMGMDSLKLVTLFRRVEERFGGICPNLFEFDSIDKASAELDQLLRSR